MSRQAHPCFRRIHVLVGALALGACSRHDRPPPPPPPPPDEVDQNLVSSALHECLALDCERAYAHLANLPPKSPLRESDAFRAVLYHHDADRLLQADIEPDLTKRRAQYQAVVEAPAVDTGLKLAAIARMARMGAASGAGEVSLNASATAVAEAAAATAALLSKSKSKNAQDQADVRAKLEPKIFTGKATAEDVGMLRTVCKAQHDAACLTRLERLILP